MLRSTLIARIAGRLSLHVLFLLTVWLAGARLR
jgi:hypothetical protein